MTKALTTTGGTFSLTPTNLREAMDLAQWIADSDLAPKDYKGKPGNVLIAVQMGAEVGLAPMQSIQNIAVINGRPAMWGDALVALVKSHPHFEYMDETFDEKSNTATCRIKRRGEDEQVRTFSYVDAKQAGLLNKQGPWQQFPKRMCAMRARSWACRDVFADALKGIQPAEEVVDLAPEPQRVEVTETKHASRTASVAAKLADKRRQQMETIDQTTGEIQEVVTLEMVIEALDQARVPADMTHVIELAAKLQNPADKEKAGEAYKFRLQELKAEAKTAKKAPEPVTVEVEPVTGDTGFDPTDAPF